MELFPRRSSSARWSVSRSGSIGVDEPVFQLVGVEIVEAIQRLPECLRVGARERRRSPSLRSPAPACRCRRPRRDRPAGRLARSAAAPATRDAWRVPQPGRRPPFAAPRGSRGSDRDHPPDRRAGCARRDRARRPAARGRWHPREARIRNPARPRASAARRSQSGGSRIFGAEGFHRAERRTRSVTHSSSSPRLARGASSDAARARTAAGAPACYARCE